MTGADPYLPGHGDVRFQVEHYDLHLEYKVHSNHLEARARLLVTAVEQLADLALDLHALEVTSLRVTGPPWRAGPTARRGSGSGSARRWRPARP